MNGRSKKSNHSRQRNIALIPAYTVSFEIAVDPQSSSTADKAEYSILALDNRYDFSVPLWLRNSLCEENGLGRPEHHTALCGMPPMEVGNHCAWFSFFSYP